MNDDAKNIRKIEISEMTIKINMVIRIEIRMNTGLIMERIRIGLEFGLEVQQE